MGDILRQQVLQMTLLLREVRIYCWNATYQNKSLDVVKCRPTRGHGREDRCEVIVREYNVAGTFGDITSAAHGDANISLLQARAVVDAIACGL